MIFNFAPLLWPVRAVRGTLDCMRQMQNRPEQFYESLSRSQRGYFIYSAAHCEIAICRRNLPAELILWKQSK